MPAASRPDIMVRPARRRPGLCLLAALAALGCAEAEEQTAPSLLEPPALNVVHPQLRKLSRVVGQPSFVQSYERTSIYPKVSAFIEKWNVDIGDRVQKGDVLADLFVPELREQLETKKATVQLDSDQVRYAQEQVAVATAEVDAAKAQLDEARAILGKFEAEVTRWDVQVKRLQGEVDRNVVAPQILVESQNQLQSNIASRDAAKAAIVSADAELAAAKAKLVRSQVDVDVARSALAVAQSEQRRLEAWVGYLKLFAPYDGIVVARNANTWDFVLPSTGDPTAMDRAPDLSPSGQAAPIYVIDRTDLVRIFVDIPERDADDVHIGSSARVKIWAYRDEWLPATVTRLAWALNTKSRTMRAEIDLPNTGSRILPGMYAYGKIIVERPNVWTLPKSAFTYVGGKAFIWQYEDGRAVRTEVQTGSADGPWVHVLNLRVKNSPDDEEGWAPIDPMQQVLVGSKLSTLTDGDRVRLTDAPAPVEAGSTETASDAAGEG